jgi:hypothetical protein
LPQSLFATNKSDKVLHDFRFRIKIQKTKQNNQKIISNKYNKDKDKEIKKRKLEKFTFCIFIAYYDSKNS